MDNNRGPEFDEEDVEEQLSILLHALRASRRRQIIHILEEVEDTKTVSTRWLARRIAAIENGIQIEHASGEPYKNAYNALSQSHLPTLMNAEVIVYDPKRQTIEKGPMFDLTALLLNLSQPAIETFYRS